MSHHASLVLRTPTVVPLTATPIPILTLTIFKNALQKAAAAVATLQSYNAYF